MSTMPTQRERLETVVSTHIEAQQQPAIHPPSHGQSAGRRADPTQIRLALRRIRPDADQVRRFGKDKDDPELQQLAASIKDVGVLQQVVVRYLAAEDCYELVSGERRFLAAQLAGLEDIPARVINVDEHDIIKLQLIENVQRKDLSPVDLGSALQRMIDDGANVAQLATLLHKSKPWIQKALTIHRQLTDDAKMRAQQSPASFLLAHLYEVAQLPAEQQLTMMGQIAAQRMTERDLRKATATAKKATRTTSRGRPTKSKPYTKTLKTDNGAIITIRFRKSRVDTDELVAALRSALKLVAA